MRVEALILFQGIVRAQHQPNPTVGPPVDVDVSTLCQGARLLRKMHSDILTNIPRPSALIHIPLSIPALLVLHLTGGGQTLGLLL